MATGEVEGTDELMDMEVFGRGDQGYTDPLRDTNDPRVVGPEPLRFLQNEGSRNECLIASNIIIFALIALLAVLLTVQLGMWSREDYNTLSTGRSNVTSRGLVPPIVQGQDVQLDDDDQEVIVSQFSLANSHECDTELAVMRATNRAVGGYLNNTDGHMSLWTSCNGTLRRAIHIDNLQRVGINTDTPAAVLDVNGQAISNVGFMTVSDERTKCNIEVFDRNASLELLRSIQPKTFTRLTETKECAGIHQLGFVAQDFLAKGKYAISITSEDTLALDTHALVAYLWAAVQNLDTQVQQLQQLQKINDGI